MTEDEVKVRISKGRSRLEKQIGRATAIGGEERRIAAEATARHKMGQHGVARDLLIVFSPVVGVILS